MANVAAKYAVQLGDKLLGAGVGDEAAWVTDSVHDSEDAAKGAAAARRAARSVGGDPAYRVVRIEATAPYAQTLVEVQS